MEDNDKLVKLPEEDDITYGEIMEIYQSSDKDPFNMITKAFILGYFRGHKSAS